MRKLVVPYEADIGGDEGHPEDCPRAARASMALVSREGHMSKRTWALITLSQTTLLALGLVFVTARGGAAAPNPAQTLAEPPASVAAQAPPPPEFVPTITRAE